MPFNDVEIELNNEIKEEQKELEKQKKELTQIKVNILNIEEEKRVIKGVVDVY
jgi:predicted  nucleic acid-binding Zn-ribbon protein